MDSPEAQPLPDPMILRLESVVDSAADMYIDGIDIVKRHPQTVILLGTGALLVTVDAGTSVVYAADSVVGGPWSTQAEADKGMPSFTDSLFITAEHGLGAGLGLLGALAATAAVLKYRLNRRK